jgi:hypothetical protein
MYQIQEAVCRVCLNYGKVAAIENGKPKCQNCVGKLTKSEIMARQNCENGQHKIRWGVTIGRCQNCQKVFEMDSEMQYAMGLWN